ncbi:MAG TPA: multiubiquitin domain-containing protein [Gemmatimonadales bacterium]|nr:multiubiquitin domain-containing protein [Gemmatimonadales bacterium]
MEAKNGIPIFINRRKYEVETSPMTGRQILAVAGFAEGYDLLLLRGEGDPTGGDPVLADQPVNIKPGLHFRVIPGNRTFGAG